MSAQSRYFSFHVAKIHKISITCKYFCRKMQQEVLKYLKMGIIRKNHPHFVICSLHFSYLNTVSDIYRIIYREMLLMQKNTSFSVRHCFFYQMLFYIMPPIPGTAAGAAGAGSGLSTNTHSVVKKRPAIEAAFSKATRSTLAGSTIPAWRISS